MNGPSDNVVEPILEEARSTLSENRVTVALVDWRLEITFTSADGDTTWGESLSEDDTMFVAQRLAGRGRWI